MGQDGEIGSGMQKEMETKEKGDGRVNNSPNKLRYDYK